MSSSNLQLQIEESEKKITALRQSQAALEQQSATLTAERETLVVAARTGDGDAKARLRKIDLQIAAASGERADDQAAIGKIEQELQALCSQLADTEEAAGREELLTLVSASLKRACANRDLLSNLTAGLKASAEELQQISTGLRQLGHDSHATLMATTVSSLRSSLRTLKLEYRTHEADLTKDVDVLISRVQSVERNLRPAGQKEEI